MTERKTLWTPGPWRIFRRSQPMDIKTNIHQVTDQERFPAAFVPAWDGGENPAPEEAFANASLIAAAPEMADCLAENIDSINRILADLSYHEGNDELRASLNAMLEDIESVLSKARGEQ